MPRVPKKNISRIMADVRHPERKKLKTTPKMASRKNSWMSFLFIIILFITIYLLNVIDLKNKAQTSFRFIYEKVLETKNSAYQFNTKNTAQSLETINKEIKKIEQDASKSGFMAFTSLAGQLIPALKEIPWAIQNFSLLSSKTLNIAENIDYLKNNVLQLLIKNEGEKIIGTLEKINLDIDDIAKLNTEIKYRSQKLENLNSQIASLFAIFSKDFPNINSSLYKIKSLIDSLLTILKSPEDQHVLFLFQNPSEMRPSGGFLGSFGDLVINRANLKEIKVDDIYNADRQLNLKLIPPEELQDITKNWGARDANWFFDFPLSASKTASLLEQSDLFLKQSTKFQAVIGINTSIFETMLDFTGSIELPAYNLTINKENFLQTIQYEVEAGRDKKPGQNPKRILSALAPLIIEKLSDLNDDSKNKLFLAFKKHLEQKDIMIYLRDPQLENFAVDFKIAGEILDLPEGFNGDYLAVVNANIAGGKSDAFISQHIKLKSGILNSGKIINEITIERTHSGQNEKDWWYRADNKNYMKILVPKNAVFTSVSGNNNLKKTGGFDYLKNNYQYDTDLANVEKTTEIVEKFQAKIGEEFNKTSFGIWFTTPAGQTKTFKAVYERGAELKIGDNERYQFIFEKQSGVNSSLEYSLVAPTGYIFKESGNPTFEFKKDDLNAREIIELTLVKI